MSNPIAKYWADLPTWGKVAVIVAGGGIGFLVFKSVGDGSGPEPDEMTYGTPYMDYPSAGGGTGGVTTPGTTTPPPITSPIETPPEQVVVLPGEPIVPPTQEIIYIQPEPVQNANVGQPIITANDIIQYIKPASRDTNTGSPIQNVVNQTFGQIQDTGKAIPTASLPKEITTPIIQGGPSIYDIAIQKKMVEQNPGISFGNRDYRNYETVSGSKVGSSNTSGSSSHSPRPTSSPNPGPSSSPNKGPSARDVEAQKRMIASNPGISFGKNDYRNYQ